MKNLILTIALASSFSFGVNATEASKNHSCNEGFLPQNDHYIPVSVKPRNGGITEDEFNDVINQIEHVYTPIISRYGGKLKVQRLWSDGTVNASANRTGNTYMIKMYGGLARHETITKDAFALVACHEVGHHIGGVPRYSGQGGSWASVEGQSDYFATSKCLRKLFENDNNEAIVKKMKVDPLVVQKCEEQFKNSNEVAMCKRLSMAGHSSASLFAAMNNSSLPRFETPDPSVVSSTYESHPDYQCRLDTYFQGSICDVDYNTEIGQRDPNNGTCNRRDKHTQGLRPTCWFKPTNTGGGSPPPPSEPTPPTNEIANTPTSNGSSRVTTSNPMITIPILFDVSNFSNAVGMAIEVSKPNRIFLNPNGTSPDRRNGLGVKTFKRLNGVYNFIPQRELPGYGSYQIRVIGLDNNQRPVTKFSDSFTLFLRN